jgi:hypothetical protein
MSHVIRVLATGLLFVFFAAEPVTGQTEAEKKAAAEKALTDKAAADKAAADKAAAEKAVADKAAADKAAADKAAADKAAADKAAAEKPPALNNDALYSKSLAALTMLFVVAVLLENAFAVIFNWRVFLAYFSLPGVKTIIMIVVSWLIVNTFGIDVMASLIAAYKSPATGPAMDPATISGPASRFITALILAGGSAGVNRIMVALGFRSLRTQEDVVPRPPQNRAWVAVLLKRSQAIGDVFVQIQEIGPAAGAANAPAPIAGIIQDKRSQLSGLLFRQKNRFPPNGGHTVSTGTIYSITVNGIDNQGHQVTANVNERYVFAPGAIVDIEVAL